MSISDFYGRMLADPDLPVEFQQRILDYGRLGRNDRVLAALVSHPNLDPEIDRVLGTISSARVRSQWIARPGRTAGEVTDLVKKETRVGVLTALASMSGLSIDVFKMIISRCDNRKIAMALATNDSAPLSIRRAATSKIGEFCRADRSSYRETYEVKALLTLRPELADAFARTARNPSLMTLVANNEDLSEEAIANLVEWGVKRPIKRVATEGQSALRGYSSPGYHAIDVAIALGQNVMVKAEVRRELLEFLNGHAKLFSATYQARAFQEAISVLETDGEGNSLANRVSSARTTDNPDTIANLVRECLGSHDQALAAALVANPAVGADEVQQVCNLISYEQRSAVIKRRLHDVDALAAILATFPNMIEDELLAKSGSPSEVLLGVVRRTQHHHYLGCVAFSRYMTSEVAGLLPVSLLGSIPELPIDVSRVLHRKVSERLGDTPARWKMFESLFNNFTGSLNDLLDVCEAIER